MLSATDDTEKRVRRAVRRFTGRHFLSINDCAVKAKVPPATLYAFFAERTHALALGTLDKLRQAVPGATWDDLLSDEEPKPSEGGPAPLEVTLVARAACWRPQPILDEAGLRVVAVPATADQRPVEAVYLADDHADLLYPPHSYLAVAPLDPLHESLAIGDHVVVVRRRRRQQEVTVREVVRSRERGMALLASRSRQPTALAPIPLQFPFEPAEWRVGGERLRLRGRVVAAVNFEGAGC